MNAFAPNEHFNSLSDEDKKRALMSGFGADLLESGLAFAIPLWWLTEDQQHNVYLRNGSAFLVNLGQSAFAVTAAHVVAEYRAAKATARTIGCQLGSVLFDLESRLINCRDDLDIATFKVDLSEVQRIGRQVVTADPPDWAPLDPVPGNFAFFAGFPAQTRDTTSDGSFVTAPYFAMPPITGITDRQITCRFDREKMPDLSGSGLPPPGYDAGGVSGGPLLIPTLVRQHDVEGVIWRFAGVVVEAAEGELFEQIVAVRAHCIHPDGRVG